MGVAGRWRLPDWSSGGEMASEPGMRSFHLHVASTNFRSRPERGPGEQSSRRHLKGSAMPRVPGNRRTWSPPYPTPNTPPTTPMGCGHGGISAIQRLPGWSCCAGYGRVNPTPSPFSRSYFAGAGGSPIRTQLQDGALPSFISETPPCPPPVPGCAAYSFWPHWCIGPAYLTTRPYTW